MPMQQFQVRAAEAVGQMSTEATVAAELAASFAGGRGTKLNRFLKLLAEVNAAVRENVISEVAGPCAPYRKDKAHGPTSQQSSTMPGQFLPVRQIRTLLDSILAELNQNYQATLLTGGIDISTVLSPFGLA